MLNLNDRDFTREVLDAKGLILVDFWAPWCPPCRQMLPVLQSLEKRFSGTLKVVKLNVDENLDWASRLGVAGIPALFFFRDGQLVDRHSGFAPESVLATRVQALQRAA